MENQLQSLYYPISLEEIQLKVAKNNSRRKSRIIRKNNLLLSQFPLDNIKELVNEFGEKIIRIDGEIPVSLEINSGDRFLFISYDQSILSHGLHRYPAKFFPELPRWIIKRYSSEGDKILDPFSGSGTTNIEALLTNRHSVGIDVDPFSRYLAKVKTTPLKEDELLEAKSILLRKIVNFKQSLVNKDDIPIYPYSENWFNQEITLELAYLRKIIEELDYSQDIKDFYRICFSSIIRAVSNADDNCTRTVIRKRLNKTVYPADALKRFVETILTSIPKMIEFSAIYPKNIDVFFPENMDARRIDYVDNFDLAVTSPPYANAVDYPRTHQLEIYWLGLVSGSLVNLKKLHVGTESVSCTSYNELHKINVEIADKKIEKIYKSDPRRAYIAYKYLEDMRLNLAQVFKSLKPGGKYVVVLGNNKIRGELFENWKYVIELAMMENFEIETYFGSEIIKHFIKVPRAERINTDWVIVLRKRLDAT